MSTAPPANSRGLKQRAIRGVAWTLPTSLGSRAVGLVGTLLLARYLLPKEYGEVSAASIVTTTASSVTTFGVGIYLVANKDVSRDEVFHVTCWFLATGVLALAAVTALSGPLGVWCDAPGLGRFMPLLVLSALIDRVVYLPERMLVRKMRFREPSLARAVSEIVYTAVSLLLASRGAGAMAIAWGGLARSTLRFAALVPIVPWREWIEPHRLRLGTMLKVVGYGVNVSVTSIATFAMSRWDNMLVSRYFGPAVMGAYNYAYNLADTPATAVGEQMSDVISVSFPHVERQKRPAALARSLTMISLIMLPLAFGLGSVAPTVVQTFFDEKWARVGSMLAILSVLSATRPMTHILHSYLYACGRPRAVLWLEWVSLGAVVGGIATIGRIGVNSACLAVGAAFILRTLIALWTVHRIDAVPISSFLVPLVRPLVVCVAMAAAIVLARPALHGAPAVVRLLCEMGLGVAVYLAGAALVFRSAAGEFLALVRSGISRGGG